MTPCEGNPCRNGGECIDIEDGTFICKCSELHGGILCEKRGKFKILIKYKFVVVVGLGSHHFIVYMSLHF